MYDIITPSLQPTTNNTRQQGLRGFLPSSLLPAAVLLVDGLIAPPTNLLLLLFLVSPFYSPAFFLRSKTAQDEALSLLSHCDDDDILALWMWKGSARDKR